MSSPVVLGGNLYICFGTTKVDTGAATDADNTPSAVILDNGSAMGYSPTVSNVTTGLYKVAITATSGNGFTAGHRYVVYASATVNSISGVDMIDEFEVLTNDLESLPDATANASATLSAMNATPPAVNIKEVNNIAVSGSGTSVDPWGP